MDSNFGIYLEGELAIYHKNVPLRSPEHGKSPGFIQLFQDLHPPPGIQRSKEKEEEEEEEEEGVVDKSMEVHQLQRAIRITDEANRLDPVMDLGTTGTSTSSFPSDNRYQRSREGGLSSSFVSSFSAPTSSSSSVSSNRIKLPLRKMPSTFQHPHARSLQPTQSLNRKELSNVSSNWFHKLFATNEQNQSQTADKPNPTTSIASTPVLIPPSPPMSTGKLPLPSPPPSSSSSSSPHSFRDLWQQLSTHEEEQDDLIQEE